MLFKTQNKTRNGGIGIMLTRNFPTLFRDRDINKTRFSDVMDEMFDEMANINRNRFVPSMDVAETEKTFEVTLALPGMNKKEINIEFRPKKTRK